MHRLHYMELGDDGQDMIMGRYLHMIMNDEHIFSNQKCINMEILCDND
jgi:hypothetical protein